MAPQTLDPNAIPRDQTARRALANELAQEAAEAFEQRDLVRATGLACDLLMLYPNERGYLDRFDEIVLSVPEPLSLLPAETGAIHVASAAGRARVLMMQRRLPEALALLTEAVRAAPALPYLHWIVRWLQPAVVPSLPWALLHDTVVTTGLVVASAVPAPPPDDDPRIPNLRAAATYFASLREVHGAQSVLWYGEGLIRRRLGEPAETLAIAEEAARRFPSDWRARTGLLNAYRDAGRPDDALAQARAALELEPSDLSPLHDAAWAFVDTVRNEDACGLFTELCERDPRYPGAQASMHYTRWLAHRSPSDEEALRRLRERAPWDAQTAQLASEIAPSTPYVDTLPPPADPTLDAARALTREIAHVVRCCGTASRVDVSVRSAHLDSPSVELAFDLALERLGVEGALRVEVDEVQAPDPRADKAQLSTRMWSYDGLTAVKAHPSGDPDAQEAIARLARTPFARDEWDRAAKEIADRFGYEGYHPMVSVLTHPPRPDDDYDAFYWTWRCQVATAVVLSHLGPWESGSARAALYSMVYGPSDWITGAAIIAFGWRVMDAPALRAEVEGIFQWLRTQIPARGFTAWEPVLAHVWRALGGHPTQVARELDAWIGRCDAPSAEKNPVHPPERVYAGLTLEAYRASLASGGAPIREWEEAFSATPALRPSPS